MKHLNYLRLANWVLRLISGSIVAAALGISIYLDLTKTYINHGGLGPVCYITLCWFLIIDVWEICALMPIVGLIDYRMYPPMIVLNDVGAGVLGTAGFLFVVAFKYNGCFNCEEVQGLQMPPKLWTVLGILYLVNLVTRVVFIGTNCMDGCMQMSDARRQRREEMRRLEEEEQEEGGV